MTRAFWLMAAVALAVATTNGGEIVLENPRVRAVLGPDAVWREVVCKATRTRYEAKNVRMSFGLANVAGTNRPANRASLSNGKLVIGFAGCDTQLTYAVESKPDWIMFRLIGVAGKRPVRVTLMRLGVRITRNVGPRLNCAWDDTFAVCLAGANLQTQGRALRRKGHAELTATTQDAPGPPLEGAAFALIAVPTADLDGALHRLSTACNLPRNCHKATPSKRLDIARQSYWFLTFGEADVEKVINLCKRSGFRQVMMNSGSWCRTVGHYSFQTGRYPDGIESLRRTVAKLHDAGIRVGMHCFVSKISKSDAYVTPVPDRRFWVDRQAELAGDIGLKDTTIRTRTDLREWPGSPVAKQKTWEGGVAKHREVILDNEIIRYETIGPKGRWDTLLGCTRGAWGTKAAVHRGQTTCRHYGVDGCINGYIIDQETTLLDESTSRLARVFNTCGFDMVYFDGGEDVDRRRFTYYVSKFQAVAMSKFTKRPLVHMGTIMTHNLWHSFTRSATVDTYNNTIRGHVIAGGTWDKLPTVREHIDRSVRYMLSVSADRMPGELGWFGIWPKGKGTDGLQLDEIEYLMGKSLGYDAPVSLQTSFSRMDAHPLTGGILDIVRAYEQLRTGGKVPSATREKLREPGREFILLRERPGVEPVFVEARPVEKVAGGRKVRAMVARHGRNVIATIWHYLGKTGTLALGPDVRNVAAVDVLGRSVAVGTDGPSDGPTIPIGRRRTTVVFRETTLRDARDALAKARMELPKPTVLWLQAENAPRVVGRMAKGADVGVEDAGALGDVIVCTGRPSPSQPKAWYCEYRVVIPHSGRWTLWARVRYPTGSDDSFGLVLPDWKVTLTGEQVLGNCGVNEKKWHWSGRGGGSTTVPPGTPITLTLPKGTLTFRVYAREGAGSAGTNPRLDCLCLTDDPAYRPNDADARAGLGKAPRK